MPSGCNTELQRSFLEASTWDCFELVQKLAICMRTFVQRLSDVVLDGHMPLSHICRYIWHFIDPADL